LANRRFLPLYPEHIHDLVKGGGLLLGITMREIQLTQGKVAIVRDDWFEYLSQWKWCTSEADDTFYAVRAESRKTILMHRVIADAKKGQLVDHWDRDGLHNWPENLRICTNGQNQWNRKKNTNATSQYKGVYWRKDAEKWQAQIQQHGKVYFLGMFVDQEDAARAYDKAAREMRGEFSRLNF